MLAAAPFALWGGQPSSGMRTRDHAHAVVPAIERSKSTNPPGGAARSTPDDERHEALR